MLKYDEIFKECKICGEICNNSKEFSKHLRIVHNTDRKEYFMTHYYKPGDEICKLCGSPVNFSECTNQRGEKRYGYLELCPKCARGYTLEKCIIRFGEVEGKIAWKEYCDKQALTNTFEFKQEKYGWTQEQFDEYNQSRSVTLENCIGRHGKEEGTKVFEDYCEKQRYVGCAEEYFIEKYGEELGKLKYLEVNSQKSLTIDNFIRKYGDIEGPKKHADYYENNSTDSASKVSQELFNYIYEKLNNKDHIHYAKLNKEFGKFDDVYRRYYFYDFVCNHRKKVIEFNGVLFHARSIEDEKFRNPFHPNQTAKECYEYDQIKLNLIENMGYQTIIIWEDDYYKNKKEVIKKCLDFLGDYND